MKSVEYEFPFRCDVKEKSRHVPSANCRASNSQQGEHVASVLTSGVCFLSTHSHSLSLPDPAFPSSVITNFMLSAPFPLLIDNPGDGDSSLLDFLMEMQDDEYSGS